MAYTFRGTVVYGMGEGWFPLSASVGNTYLNTNYGHVYTCTAIGTGAYTGKTNWRYVRTDAISKPNFAVYGLGAPKRERSGSATRIMTIGWKLAEWQTSAQNKSRATGVKAKWTLDVSTSVASKDPRTVLDLGNTSHVTSRINLDSLRIGSKTYTRESFYPFTSKRLHAVTAEVILTNPQGDSTVTAKASRKFTKPKKPVISKPNFNADTGTVSATITTDAGEGYRERYDTRYSVSVYDSRTKKTRVIRNESDTRTSFSVSYDVQGYQSLAYNDYVKVTVKAWSRGYAGASDAVSRVYYVSYPAQPTIKSVSVSSKSSTGKVTARISTNSSTYHPVDKVVLEYLANVEYSKASAIAGDASWTTTEIVDDGECTALAMPVAELIPDRGKYSWLRVRAYHAAENVLYRYSNYVQLSKLHTPAATAADERVKIFSAVASADGKSAVVHLGWNKNERDDATGTELSWASERDAWKSTKEPSKHLFTWSDGEVTVSGVTYYDSATITIKDLDEGSAYYIRARRYLDGDTTTYSPYSNTVTCVPSEQPESIVAKCDGYIAVGEPLQVYWSFSGNGLQKEWQIVSADEIYGYSQVIGATGNPNQQNYYELVENEYVLTTDTSVDDTKTYYQKESFGTVIASGEGSIRSAQISAERLASFNVDSLTFTVQASTGSGFVSSEEHTVSIIEKPVITLSADAILTEQPFSFTVTSSSVGNLIVVLSSQGASSQFARGRLVQTEGDTIYSDEIIPQWTEGNDSFSTTITLPSGLDLWNLCNYELSVIAVDTTTGLKSDEANVEFSVDYENLAVSPTATVTPRDEVDADGVHHMAVDIVLTEPTGSSQTDVYDIYRMDGGKANLVGQSYPLDYEVTDEYAPFGDGNLRYRIALRTVDGDEQYRDFEYVLPSEVMRFDWADGMLEFPYGLTMTDSYSKDVEFRSHLDGSIDGYWRQNVERKSALGTSVIKLIQPTEIELAGMLARYTGAVFVRLPNGAAYEADVQVTDMSVKNKAVTAISIDATEIGLTQEFRLPVPYTLEDEGE